MRHHWGLLLVVFLVSLVVFVTTNVPSKLLFDRFVAPSMPPQLVIENIEGPWWRGSATARSTKALPLVKVALSKLSWQWRPVALFRGQLRFRATLDGLMVSDFVFGDFRMDAFVGFGGQAQAELKSVNSPLDLEASVAQEKGAAYYLTGTVKQKKPHPQISALLGLMQRFISPDGTFRVRLSQ